VRSGPCCSVTSDAVHSQTCLAMLLPSRYFDIASPLTNEFYLRRTDSCVLLRVLFR